MKKPVSESYFHKAATEARNFIRKENPAQVLFGEIRENKTFFAEQLRRLLPHVTKVAMTLIIC